MDAQPSYRQRAETAVVLFSVVSPGDDDIQQEFVQSNKPKQLILAKYKATREVRTFGTSRGRSALLPPRRLATPCNVIGRVSIDYKEINGEIFSSRTGSRSPPSKSS